MSKGIAHSNIMQKVAPKGVQHWKAKLSPNDVLSIRELAKSGVPRTTLSGMFDISRQYVSKIVLRQKWNHVP